MVEITIKVPTTPIEALAASQSAFIVGNLFSTCD
jgi:hypothetical protein